MGLSNKVQTTAQTWLGESMEVWFWIVQSEETTLGKQMETILENHPFSPDEKDN